MSLQKKTIDILLVEDNPGDTRLICEMLGEVMSSRFGVLPVDRVSKGLDHLSAGGIDAVLLDLSLPGSRGLESFDRVHAHAPSVPVVVLTGLDDETLAVEAVRQGAQDYLVKGQVNSLLLARSIHYAIERRRAEESRERLLASERDQRRVAEHLATENARLYADLQQRMAELQHTHAQLVQSAKLAAIGQLAAGVAHELNNPLQAVLGFGELLLRDPGLSARTREDLGIIVEESRRARDIVRQLLEFARQSESKWQTADLGRLVRETVVLLGHQLETTGIRVEEHCACDLEPVAVDVGRIKQVVFNLLNNALQAMPRGGMLTIDCSQVGNEVVLRVADTGPGITPEYLAHIFDPFFTTKPVGEGTGLGLSVSLGIIHDHGGRIEVQSKLGAGSVFEVWLPVALEMTKKAGDTGD